jgi:hypothetical protein
LAVTSKLWTITVFVIVDLVEIVSHGCDNMNQLSVISYGCGKVVFLHLGICYLKFVLCKVVYCEYRNLELKSSSFGRYVRHLLSFWCFSLYGEARKKYRWIIILFSDSFLCIISTNTNYNYVKFFRYNFEVLHCLHVCNCWHAKVSYWICRCVMICHHTKFHMPGYYD